MFLLNNVDNFYLAQITEEQITQSKFNLCTDIINCCGRYIPILSEQYLKEDFDIHYQTLLENNHYYINDIDANYINNISPNYYKSNTVDVQLLNLYGYIFIFCIDKNQWFFDNGKNSYSLRIVFPGMNKTTSFLFLRHFIFLMFVWSCKSLISCTDKLIMIIVEKNDISLEQITEINICGGSLGGAVALQSVIFLYKLFIRCKNLKSINIICLSGLGILHIAKDSVSYLWTKILDFGIKINYRAYVSFGDAINCIGTLHLTNKHKNLFQRHVLYNYCKSDKINCFCILKVLSSNTHPFTSRFVSHYVKDNFNKIFPYSYVINDIDYLECIIKQEYGDITVYEAFSSYLQYLYFVFLIPKKIMFSFVVYLQNYEMYYECNKFLKNFNLNNYLCSEDCLKLMNIYSNGNYVYFYLELLKFLPILIK